MKFYKNEILDDKMNAVWNRLKEFREAGVLGGGTALALQLGHRKSIDFDFICRKSISNGLALKAKKVLGKIKILINSLDELTFLTSEGVKVTFLYYPFKIGSVPIELDGLKLLNIMDIAVSKAYALNRRANAKDYIDIYFILKSGILLDNLVKKAYAVFGELFSEKLFLAQLLYMEDVDMSNFKQIIFIGNNKVDLKELQKYFKSLIKI